MKVMKYKYVYKMANKGKLFLLYSGSNLHINLLFGKLTNSVLRILFF